LIFIHRQVWLNMGESFQKRLKIDNQSFIRKTINSASSQKSIIFLKSIKIQKKAKFSTFFKINLL